MKKIIMILFVIIGVILLSTRTIVANDNIAVSSNEEITKIMMNYIGGDIEEPLIKINENIFVKNSNLNGVKIANQTYYYNLSPHTSYDPIALSKVTKDNVEIIQTINTGDFNIRIYIIK